MNHSIKRALSLLLSMSMTVGMLPLSAGAAGQADPLPAAQEVVEAAEYDESVSVESEEETVLSDEAETVIDEAAAESSTEAAPLELTEAAEETVAAKEETDEQTEAETEAAVSVPAYELPDELEIQIDLDEAKAAVMSNGGVYTVNEEDPEMLAAEAELNRMKVAGADGAKVPLTAEQIQNVLGMYQMYLDQQKSNADVLGVQTPFFLTYNDKKDGLGAMGEMLVLAGYTVDQVRAGEYAYDDLLGMIMNFYYGDYFTIKFYGKDIKAARDKALKAVKESGAKTEAQKLMVLCNWLAQNNSFDMAYIMAEGTDSPMNVEQKKVNPHYDEIYQTIYQVYEGQIYSNFHDNIYNMIAANVRQQYVQGCMEQGMPQADAEAAADAYMKSAEVAAGVEEYTRQMMDTEDTQTGIGMTFNQEVPVFTAQAAAGLTEGVINYWQSTTVGAMALGNSVCIGYSKALAYLVQCMYPQIYLKSGTDIDKASNWKTAEELYYNAKGELDPSQNYNVDLARITFDANVFMYGTQQKDFGADHFWNAVKLDGKWYFIDPCYIDVFTEVMSKERVETNGNMDYLYFLFSMPTTDILYGGYFKELKSLYNNLATDDSYKGSWLTNIKSAVSTDGSNAYYAYHSYSFLNMLEQLRNGNIAAMQRDEYSMVYRIVKHPFTFSDKGDGRNDYTTLIDFNCRSNASQPAVTRVYDPASGKMVDNELLTTYYRMLEVQRTEYPSIEISVTLYKNQLYFNLANAIFSYDLKTGKVTRVKEYNKVYAKRDPSIAFGGTAFHVIDEKTYEANKADTLHYASVNTAPVAGLTLKDDGKLYVDIATNYCYVSGRTPHDMYVINREGVAVDSPDVNPKSYGYAYQESNYNPANNSFINNLGMPDDMLAMLGIARDSNDNDEFMWAANFKEVLDMSHLAGGSHSYSKVSVDPFCGRDAYEEERCTVCGREKTGSRVTEAGTACDHHYVKFAETYYTKDNRGNWKTGNAVVCTMCGYGVSEPVRPNISTQNMNVYRQLMADYEAKKAVYDAEAAKVTGHVYKTTDAKWAEDYSAVTFSHAECEICAEVCDQLDCLINDPRVNNNREGIFANLDQPATFPARAELDGVTCEEDGETVYTAAITYNGRTETFEKRVATPALGHDFADGDVCVRCGKSKNLAKITLADTTATYTGSAVVSRKAVTDSTGKISYIYYVDKAAATMTTPENSGAAAEGEAPVCPGVYYVKAVMASTEEYASAESNIAVLKINPKKVGGVKVVNVTSGLQVAWDSVVGAQKYAVYRKLSGETSWTKVKVVKSTGILRFTDKSESIKEGKKAVYMVKAFAGSAASSASKSAVIYRLSKPVITSVKNSSAKKAVVTLEKKNSKATGYQIEYSYQKDFSSSKTVKITSYKTLTKTLSGLTKGKTCYVRVRTYKVVSDVTYYGIWSDKKSVKIKK